MSRRIFVFGSNWQGRHGAGAALHALEHWGAIVGQAEGLQGDSYGIVTKELRRGHPPVSLAVVRAGVDRFLRFARAHPEMEFLLSPIGCGLAGFTCAEVAPLFRGAPANVVVPPEFAAVLEDMS